MKRIFLGMALHNHQPVGNYPWVFEQAYRQAYLPMIEALERHPAIRLSLHYSGPLLDWLREHRPAFLRRLALLARRRQVELMTGGYYEPVLAVIPDADKLGQIRLMTRILRRELGARPTGLWLAERVWEPHLPRALRQAGVQWTVVDDTHFKAVGFEESQLFGYYLCEEQGQAVKVFATEKHLRYLLPWRPVREAIDFLRAEADESGHRVAVFGDDGEKFGLWPNTYELCWKQGWVEELFTALEQNADWLATIPLGEYASQHDALGMAYLPTASYDEMMGWALPFHLSHDYEALKARLERDHRDRELQHLRGGFWRHFLVKYPEINAMHKKMLRVHDKVRRAGGAGRSELWKGQCNCPYWHGVFGGVYISVIRAANFQHLIRAEVEADVVLHLLAHGPSGPAQRAKVEADAALRKSVLARGPSGPAQGAWQSVEVKDYDQDGQPEVLLESGVQDLYFKPREGGVLFEWDVKRPPFNLISTVARRPEAYHLDIRQARAGRGAGLENIHGAVRLKDTDLPRLAYDRYRRACLLDHFLDSDVSLQSFADCAYAERGDFANGAYAVSVRETSGTTIVTLERSGDVRQGRRRKLPVLVRKVVTARRGRPGMAVAYLVENQGVAPLEAVLALEWNFNVLGEKGNPAAYLRLGADGEERRADAWGTGASCTRLSLGNRDLGVGLSVALDQPVEVWHFPVEALANSEAGLGRSYQGTCVAFKLPLRLSAGEKASLQMVWKVGQATPSAS